MQMGKNSRKAVALAGVLAVTLIGTTAVGLWAGAVGPASTDAALVEPAVEMDHDAGVCIGDPLEDFSQATPLNVDSGPASVECWWEPYCWVCSNGIRLCWG